MSKVNPNRLRLFMALWPSAQVRQNILNDVEKVIVAAGGSPVPPVNYHMTLAFLGSVRESSVDDISRFMQDVRFKAFTLRLDRTGFWPRSQVAWVGPTQVPLELSSLVENIWDKLENLGFMRDSLGPYRPHVTLCRKSSSGLGMQLDYPIDWPVNAFGLAMSRPAERAPVYTVLEQFAAGD